MQITKLTEKNIPEILPLVSELNPNTNSYILEERLKEMFKMSYLCFGAYKGNILIAVCGAWVTVRLYSGKQVELDNFVIKPEYRSKGIGKELMQFIYSWAIENECNTCELNTYIENYGSHKFYINENFQILGYHFLKKLCTQDNVITEIGGV